MVPVLPKSGFNPKAFEALLNAEQLKDFRALGRNTGGNYDAWGKNAGGGADAALRKRYKIGQATIDPIPVNPLGPGVNSHGPGSGAPPTAPRRPLGPGVMSHGPGSGAPPTAKKRPLVRHSVQGLKSGGSVSAMGSPAMTALRGY